MKTSRSLVVLMNLGTPDSPDTRSVARYLRQFLTDPRVIDIPTILRYALVYGIISLFRSPKSARAYQSIWTRRGSPLLLHTESMAVALQEALEKSYPGQFDTIFPMRYGKPSFAEHWKLLRKKGYARIILAPLYPQYASSSTGSSLEEALRVLSKEAFIPALQTIPAFPTLRGFIEAQAAIYRQAVSQPVDHTIISFHGLPERHIRRCDPTETQCTISQCCDDSLPPFCYRAQCFATAHALATALGLPKDRYTVAFQSRLGRDPWIKPATDELIPQLARSGIRSLAIVSPSFVADCLETLEEIGIRAKESFLQAGGDSFYAVPCVNSHQEFIAGLMEAVTSKSHR